jgi:hypothetical protein
VDINLSSDDDTIIASKPNAPTGQKVLAGDDAGDDGSSSTELTAPNPTSSSMPRQSYPSAAD